MALVVLVALLVAGLAHASRLCGIDRHVAPAADAVRCPAHHAADVAPASEGAGPSSAIPVETPPHERTPSCCTSGTSLAALPGARPELARDVALQPLAAIAVGAPLLSSATLRITPVVRAARDPGSGPRRHLVHRILLI
jgi:hypothetical protein